MRALREATASCRAQLARPLACPLHASGGCQERLQGPPALVIFVSVLSGRRAAQGPRGSSDERGGGWRRVQADARAQLGLVAQPPTASVAEQETTR